MPELQKEFIETNKITDEQVKAFNTLTSDSEATIKKGYDETYKETANTNAENILKGAADKVNAITKIERKDKEKLAEYYTRAWTEWNTTSLADIAKQKTDLEAKLKAEPGNGELAKTMAVLEGKYSDLQKKEAEFDKLKESGVEQKYTDLQAAHVTMKEQVAFQSVLPKFAESVNDFEAAAKWKSFIDGVLKTSTIEMVDGEAVAVDKDNVHKTTPLKDLVAKDEKIQELVDGRKVIGPGGDPKKLAKISGIPFDLKEDHNSADRSTAIKKYLLEEEKLSPTDPKFSERFEHFNAIATGNKKVEPPKAA